MSLVIPGPLQFGGAPGIQGQDLGYAQAYQNAANVNSQIYQNVLGGFQNLGAAQQARHSQIQSGYDQLGQNVMGQLGAVEAPQRQAIADAYARQQGLTAQSAIDRGLGNTTVADSLQRGVLADKQKADVELTGQMAGLRAQYAQQLGLAGLGYAGQASQEDAALAGQQLGFMGSFRQQMPDVAQYANMAQQARQFQQNYQLKAQELVPKAAGGYPSGFSLNTPAPNPFMV